MSRRTRCRILLAALAIVVLAVARIGPGLSLAEHESTNALTFEPVQQGAPPGEGSGTIDFRGGAEPESRWTATFRFTGLQPATRHVVVVQGRFGEDGTPDATAFTPICAFTTDERGEGGCWHYFVGLRRLGVVQVRLGDADGAVVLQATAAEGEPGSIARTRNAFSPAPTTTPAASPVATPAA